MTAPLQHPVAAGFRVLIACETSGVMRRAFAARGHDAWSCDLLAAEDGSNRHIRGDVRDHLGDGWDLLIVAHPPCTRLCNSGVRWLHVPPQGRTLAEMWADLDAGVALFAACWQAPVPRIAVENPVMHRHARERLPSDLPRPQIVQPWWFGHRAKKATGFYLRGLPPLVPTDRLTPPPIGSAEDRQWQAVHRCPPGPLPLAHPLAHVRGDRSRLCRPVGRPRPARGGAMTRPAPRDLPACGRCGARAPYGFGPPYGHQNRGTLHACWDHRAEAEAARNRLYGLAGQDPAPKRQAGVRA